MIIEDSEEAYQTLREHASEIEDKLKSTNTTVYWGDLRETRAGNMRSEVGVKRDADIEDTDSWEAYFDWMFEMGELLHSVFPKRLHQLD